MYLRITGPYLKDLVVYNHYLTISTAAQDVRSTKNARVISLVPKVLGPGCTKLRGPGYKVKGVWV